MISIPRSKRKSLDWDLHAVLDEVDDRDGDACTHAIMVRFGVPRERRDVYDALRKAFGDHPQRVTMDTVLDALTRSVPITWIEDTTTFPLTKHAELVSKCTALLERVARPSMPKLVATDVMALFAHELGDLEKAPDVEAAVIQHLVGQLWRCQGKERALAAWLVDALEREGAIVFR